MTSQWINELIFITLLNDENVSNVIVKEVILHRHPSLARAHALFSKCKTTTGTATTNGSSSLSSPSTSLSCDKVLAIVKDHLSQQCRKILNNLLVCTNDDDESTTTTTFGDLVPLLQSEFLQMSSMMDSIDRFDHTLDSNLFHVHQAFKEHLAILQSYIKDYQVPCKNSIDSRRTVEIITRAQVMESEKKIAKCKSALQACPTRDAVKLRMERLKDMKGKMTLLTKQIQNCNERLALFKSLDPQLLLELDRVTIELAEKRWAVEQLGGFCLDESSIVN